MARPVFYPYKMHSSSAKLLAKEFDSERVKPDGKFRNNFKRPVINWGNSEVPEWMKRWKDQIILNHPNAVAKSINKLSSFKAFVEAGVKCPEFTTNKQKALYDWRTEGNIVVGRKTVTGKGGQGIVLFDPFEKQWDDNIDEIIEDNCLLYTKYFKKLNEYRVHVFDGKIIDFSQKKRTHPDADNKVRNVGNGWIFAREGVELPECVGVEAIKAVASLGLTFGAVDVGYNVKKDEPCVFEVNSAPGIINTTIISYKNAIKEYLNAAN